MQRARKRLRLAPVSFCASAPILQVSIFSSGVSAAAGVPRFTRTTAPAAQMNRISMNGSLRTQRVPGNTFTMPRGAAHGGDVRRRGALSTAWKMPILPLATDPERKRDPGLHAHRRTAAKSMAGDHDRGDGGRQPGAGAGGSGANAAGYAPGGQP